ncbi:malto-oligosyltrehalose synthase [Streptomyces lunaelactis]|uniref:malto-oligosyltrehalose synthase n=1 Tax=Streptomyces lunaelactis TaxID=1535768 RepID=UPI0015845CE7|nr:malto-oligosyltrehalose synthase [Streptomyces lunaelactis]NUK07788.1 malto-oligosyltrehalose synthase [Streptomyces lunaelactis]NUK56697.1 malto-oligosyltrehalose synthase [Streptomyces lunaelactis]NUL09378.1 malto-oligosyltrehalose synthase [Streptomyces lunaelactis]NUL22082.1 malto-oligosyltrehalose synthase [Streptomyces lunaelactis]
MTPTATYRLQLQPDFPFAAAADAVPYLAELGVSHLHLSPVLEAVPGSAHGYDVVDPARVREELGGEEGLRRLARTAREHGLGLVLDIVPNHMAAVPRHNRALWEVLREGPLSPYARWFDIDWEAGAGKVLLPVLAGRIGDELGAMRVEGDVLHYGEQRFPLRESTAKLPLPELLDAQWYRLGWWRLARTELNYRRFFTISELIGVRVEDPEVFDATHGKILELVRDGVVEGLRVDHPDGLADPEAYLRRLDEATGGTCWTVVEKILSGDERLPAGWRVAGTTGYDALRHVDGLFTDPAGEPRLVDQYREFASPAGDRGGYWEATVRRAAYKVLTRELAAETTALTRLAERVCAADPALRDHAPWTLRAAVRELLVRVPVYRPYRIGGEEALRRSAALRAKAAFAVAEEAAAVDVVRDLALGLLGDGPDKEAFRTRFAQTASALRAKSVEDTAFYRYVPLISANEVGGEPGSPAVSPELFHAYCARLARDWPATGTVLTTHDTKRSADVRARIAVLSECPDRWADFLGRVTAEAGRLAGGRAPDPQLAWVAWQTAVGFGFPYADRLEAALLKAVREAGLHTSWTEPDPAYEEAVTAFVAAGPAGPPLYSVALFARELDPYVRANALGATLVQLTMPGVPDVYQGTEREFLALVDPDNRRPFRQGAPDEKTALTTAALRLRRDRPEVFGASGAYAPLTASGPAAAHCLAFCRTGEVVTAVTRLSLRLAEAGGWADTELTLPEGRWADLLAPEREFGGGPVPLAELFAERPVALLSRGAVREGSATG